MLLFFCGQQNDGIDGAMIRWFFLTFSKKNDKQKYLISLFYLGGKAFFAYFLCKEMKIFRFFGLGSSGGHGKERDS